MKVTNIIKNFDQLANEIIVEAETFKFDLKNLPEITDYKESIRKNDLFANIFVSLDSKIRNCIYWFEVESSEQGHELKNLLNLNRDTLSNIRKVPVDNKNLDSKVLYVGIRRGGYTKIHNLSNLSGRIVQHLGYYQKGTTQGLQLAHWAKNLDYTITLKIVEFEDLPNAYLNTIEKIIAFKLKPLLGFH